MSCDDGDACTADACDPAAGSCSYDPVDCSDGDACTTDSCHSILGCSNAPVVCDVDEVCVDGDCQPMGTSELHGSNPGDVTIPASDGNQCPNPQGSGELTIGLSGAPSGNVVSKVKVAYEIGHTCLEEARVRVWARTDRGSSRGQVVREACETGGGCGCSTGIHTATVDNLLDMNGLNPNQDWHLSVDDCWTGDDVGNTVRHFEIWVEYSLP